MTLTIILTLLTCNTWTGVCLTPVVDQWSVTVPEHIDKSAFLADQIETCRIRGVRKALIMTLTKGESHYSTNVDCKWTQGRGA